MDEVYSNALSTVTGNVAKARILIQDNRSRKTQTLKLKDMGKQKSSGAGSANALASFADSAANAASQAASAAATAAKQVSKKAARKARGLEIEAKYNRYLTVQFNPASITLSSVGGDDDVQTTNYTQDGAGVSRGPVGLHTEMSVKLIFDQISNYGAFVQDMFTISSSRGLKQATEIIGGLIGETKASVQMIVEAFIATMRNENTRRICFAWGEFYYEGMLSRVNSTYTMFDLSGNPVRAEVNLVIYLVDDDLDKEFNEYWYDAYYAAFIAGNPEAEAMMELAEKGKAFGL